MTASGRVGGSPLTADELRRAGGIATDVIPLARPVLGPEEEAAVIEVLR